MKERPYLVERLRKYGFRVTTFGTLLLLLGLGTPALFVLHVDKNSRCITCAP